MAVIASVEQQGKLTAELKARFLAADTKQRLEDLYLPFKQKRRTRAQIARELGLEPLADALLADPSLDPQEQASAYLKPGDEKGEGAVADVKAALDGAKDILAERFAEKAEILEALREQWWQQGQIVAKVVEGKQAEGETFRDYFDHSEPVGRCWGGIQSSTSAACPRTAPWPCSGGARRGCSPSGLPSMRSRRPWCPIRSSSSWADCCV